LKPDYSFILAALKKKTVLLARNRLSQNGVSEMFDRISSAYDRTNRFLSLGFDMSWRRTLAKYLPPTDHLKLLDLATGTGDQIAALIQQKAPIVRAIGIDLSQEMLQIAQQKLANRASECEVQFQIADAESLPFHDQSFDVCTFSFGIRNVQHPLTALKEMFRVTQPKGRCLILEFSLPSQPFRFFYLFYLRRIVPLIGKWIAKDSRPYRYLNETIEQFASGEEFMKWMRQTGWMNVSATDLFFGSVTLYVGEKG
jgi:demethylmenaquinone methyltransferase/2-methoxy-6-polyprenyl-1,4-benzoquinol methylase